MSTSVLIFLVLLVLPAPSLQQINYQPESTDHERCSHESTNLGICLGEQVSVGCFSLFACYMIMLFSCPRSGECVSFARLRTQKLICCSTISICSLTSFFWILSSLYIDVIMYYFHTSTATNHIRFYKWNTLQLILIKGSPKNS